MIQYIANLCELTLAQRHSGASCRGCGSRSTRPKLWRGRRRRSTQVAGLKRQRARGCARLAPRWLNPLVDYESIYHYYMSHSKHL